MAAVVLVVLVLVDVLVDVEVDVDVDVEVDVLDVLEVVVVGGVAGMFGPAQAADAAASAGLDSDTSRDEPPKTNNPATPACTQRLRTSVKARKDMWRAVPAYEPPDTASR